MNEQQSTQGRVKQWWNDDEDRAAMERIAAFRDAAIADGWEAAPTYPGREGVERAVTLRRDGFSMQIVTRDGDNNGPRRYCGYLSIWGPDRGQVAAPDIYSMDAVRDGVRVCSVCGEKDVDTKIAGFATRACLACLLETRRKLEYPGWCD